jgi:chromatin segregation and condensation protein Rec8/ScpA/Scc1 (kleisin family)
VGEEFFYEVELEEVTLEEKVAMILQGLAENGRALFVDLIARYPRRIHIVVTFMAILELARLGRIAVAQEASFRQIWLYPVVDGRVVTEAAVEGAPVPDAKAGQGMNPEDNEPDEHSVDESEREHGNP